MAFGFQVTFDAADPRALGAFWAQALGYVDQPPPDGFASWDDALDAWGVPADQRDRMWAVVDPDGAGPRVLLQKVPEPKTAKNRVHLDVNVSRGGGPAVTADPDDRPGVVRAHAARLAALGASQVQEFDPPGTEEFWIVMRDPEGNEFCLQ